MNDSLGDNEQQSSTSHSFMCGVCEGFYGKPWTLAQRLVLFQRMQRFGMDTYLYAPKDDYKHRLDWRELYSEEESDELKQLITDANKCCVNFVYALSPGLDIVFSSLPDMDALKAKLQQVKSMGCKNFALLFDDIDDELCFEDKVHYSSPADAQACLTNNIYDFLDHPDIFLFCPTEYSTNRTEPDLISSKYLQTIGEKLNSKIDILWTGPKVVSQLITDDSINTVSQTLRRPVTIWDNLHANDYDQTRLYLGPYSGRDGVLTSKLRGVLTNPNCEFEVNFIAMHTLAQWSINKCTRFPPNENNSDCLTAKMDIDTDVVKTVEREGSLPLSTEEMDNDESQYNEKKALTLAVLDWLPELYKTKTSSGQTRAPVADTQHRPSIETCAEAVPSNESSTDGIVSKSRAADLPDLLTVDDVLLICHLFYLPYEHGPRASFLLQSACWLLSHIPPVRNHLASTNRNSSSSSEDEDVVYEWYNRAGQFHRLYREIAIVVDKLVNIPNRELLYEVYSYITDMRSTLALVNSYIKWHGTEKKTKGSEFKSGDQEPWVYRGGLLGEFRMLLPIDNRLAAKSFISVASTRGPYTVRPFFINDKADVYSVCDKTFGSVQCPSCKHYPQLIADWYVGGFLESTSCQCYVLEDVESIVCGYVVLCTDAKQYYCQLMESWIPTLRSRYPSTENDASDQDLLSILHNPLDPLPDQVSQSYPSIMSVGILPTFNAVSAIESMLRCACRVLQGQRSSGVYALLPANSDLDVLMAHAFKFTDISSIWPAFAAGAGGWKIVGTKFHIASQ